MITRCYGSETCNSIHVIHHLVSTNQLVDQVVAKSRDYGVAEIRYVRGQALASEFYDGKAVLIGTYETLFNGRSKFGVRNSWRDVVRLARSSWTTPTSHSPRCATRLV